MTVARLSPCQARGGTVTNTDTCTPSLVQICCLLYSDVEVCQLLYPCYQVFMFVFFCHSLFLRFPTCSPLLPSSFVPVLGLVEGPVVDRCSIWDRGVSLELVITVNYVIFPMLLQCLVLLLTSKGKAFMAIRFYIFIFNIV